MNLNRLSVRRQKVHRLQLSRQTLEQIALARDPMVAGSLLERRLRPGGPAVYYLSIPTPNNSRHRYVRKEDVEEYKAKARARRQFVHALAEWAVVNKAIAKELRAVGRERCEKMALPGRQR